MANTPKKMKDPTEAALSAIQDALSIRETVAEPGKSAPAAHTEELGDEAPWRKLRSSAAQKDVLIEDEPDAPVGEGTRHPANDDRESIGQILRTLQRRPARTSYTIATVFAVVWVLAGIVLGWTYLPELQAALGPTGLNAPVLGVLGAIFLAPIVFFYVLAHMAWRSQELRLITQSMAEVAMRLAEPETVARESIVTVGQSRKSVRLDRSALPVAISAEATLIVSVP